MPDSSFGFTPRDSTFPLFLQPEKSSIDRILRECYNESNS